MGQALTTELRKSVTATPALRPPASLGTAHVGDEWPQLWFSARQQKWNALVIVPASSDGATALFIANNLVESARLYCEDEVQLVNGIGAGHVAANEIVAALKLAAQQGTQSIIAVDCPMTSHAAIHIARAADAAILLVPLGAARLTSARQTIDAIGRGRFIGSVTLKGR